MALHYFRAFVCMMYQQLRLICENGSKREGAFKKNIYTFILASTSLVRVRVSHQQPVDPRTVELDNWKSLDCSLVWMENPELRRVSEPITT